MAKCLILSVASAVLVGMLDAASLTPVANTGLTLEPVTGRPQPVWSGNGLLTLDSYSSAIPGISVLDSRGAQIGMAAIAIPGAKATGIRCMGRGSDGTIVAGGWTSSADGRTAEILVSVSSGGVMNITRIDPFAARQIAVAQDGSIWVQGFIGRNHDHIEDPDPTHGIIRHFDSKGKLLNSFLPEDGLSSKLRTKRGFLAISSGDGAQSGTGSVGWISWTDTLEGNAPGAYIEIASDGTVREYPLPAMDSARGFALTGGGLPIADVLIERGRPGHPARSALLVLDRQTGSWSMLDLPGGNSMAGKGLLGGTGHTLAIWDLKSRIVTLFQE